jgi:DNA-binding NarL/FixJ family response regulator
MILLYFHLRGIWFLKSLQNLQLRGDARMPIRILVADDHPIVRDGLIAILNTQPDFEVVGEASTGPKTVEQVTMLHPDVVLLDLEMPEIDGVEALRLLRQSSPDVRVIVFTAFDTDERILGAVRAGARGYLLKGAPREEIFQAIRVVHAGGSLLQPIVASKLLRQVSQEPAILPGPETLTPRELEVLRLLARGLENKEIAAELVIAERTVKFHVSSIQGKLGAGNRTEAVVVAAKQGLIKL